MNDHLYTKNKTPFDASLFGDIFTQEMVQITSPRQLGIRHVTHSYANAFVLNHHYLKRKIYIARNVSYGLFLPSDLCVGVAMFGYPVWTTYPGLVPPLQVEQCPELIRLCTISDLPRNSESYFLSHCIKQMRIDWANETGTEPQCITSFCDLAYGFNGAIYRATNFDSRRQDFREQSQ